MKIHIVQRNDTFESIARKYDVSIQDLVGMILISTRKLVLYPD